MLPLTLNQEHFLVSMERLRALHHSLGTAQYQVVCRIHAPVDVTSLQTALNMLVHRHEALRTTFHICDRYNTAERAMHLTFAARTGLFIPGFFEQRIHSGATVELHQRECSGGPSDDEQVIWDEVQREAGVGLALNAAPAVRAVLVRGGPWPALILVVTHLTVDGWSLNVLVQELESLYRGLRDGGDTTLPVVTAQWSDFVVWQRDQLVAGSFADAEDYWCRQWVDIQLDSLQFDRIPFAIRPTGHAGLNVELRRLWLSDEESAAVRTLVKGLRLTPYLVFRTALTAVWSRCTGTSRTALWANFTNRLMPGSEGMIGWCANTHVVTVDVDHSWTFAQLSQEVSAAITGARTSESLPLPGVWRKLGRNGYGVGTRINCDVFPGRPSDGTTALEVVIPPTGLPTMDLDLRLANERGRYGFVAMFNAARYESGGVERLLDDIRKVLLTASLDSGRTLVSCLEDSRVAVG